MKLVGSIRGQAGGETLIKLLVVAIIAVIAIALAKSYFQQSSKKVEEVVEKVYGESSVGLIGMVAILSTLFFTRKNANQSQG